MRHLHLLLASVLTVGVSVGPASASTADSDSSASAAESPAKAQRGAARVRVKGEFDLATFNVLGNDHTRRGKKRGFGSGADRMRLTVQAFRQRGVDVVALQEFEAEQWRAFGKLTKGRYRVWADKKDIANAVAWRTKKFAFVKGNTVGIPYFSGKIKQMPVVTLRLRSTGQKMVFTSFHNPSTSKKHPGNAKWRTRATTREIKLANKMRKRGRPVFLSGDFNDRSERWHCRVARGTNMVTAGNGDRRGGSCRPLDRMRIDWIFGSNGVKFSRYAAVESRRVQRASDHALIVVRVR